MPNKVSFSFFFRTDLGLETPQWWKTLIQSHIYIGYLPLKEDLNIGPFSLHSLIVRAVPSTFFPDVFVSPLFPKCFPGKSFPSLDNWTLKGDGMTIFPAFSGL